MFSLTNSGLTLAEAHVDLVWRVLVDEALTPEAAGKRRAACKTLPQLRKKMVGKIFLTVGTHYETLLSKPDPLEKFPGRLEKFSKSSQASCPGQLRFFVCF